MAQLLFDNGDILGVGDKLATNIFHIHFPQTFIWPILAKRYYFW